MSGYTQRTTPLRHLRAVTPSDSADLTHECRAVKVDVAGDLAIVDCDGTATTSYFAAGIWHPVVAVRIKSTGTTATGIVAGW